MDFIQRGPRTLTDKNALLAELDQVRRTGIAANDEELESALRSIAAPVRSRSGQVVAAVNVAIPWSPVAISDLVTQLGPAIQATAKQIAARVIRVSQAADGRTRGTPELVAGAAVLYKIAPGRNVAMVAVLA